MLVPQTDFMLVPQSVIIICFTVIMLFPQLSCYETPKLLFICILTHPLTFFLIRVADMMEILNMLRVDYPKVFVKKPIITTVHKTLGRLIKERKVYFTGSGYFLVMPDTSMNNEINLSKYHLTRDMSCQTESKPEVITCDIATSTCWPRDTRDSGSSRKLW